MDERTDLPKISPEVNRDEKKKSGLAALLLRFGIGSEAGGGVGGAGLMGNLLNAGVSGGILATKAGIIGLVLVGTTVAGSLGVVAYKLFGPQASDRSDASFSSLFSPKPPSAGGLAQDGSASADGASRSLQFLADANSKPSAEQPADEAASAAPADASAAAASVAPPPLKNDNVFGSSMAKLKTDKKFGSLSQGASSGASRSMSLPGGGTAGNASLLANASRGNMGGMSGARAGTGKLGSLRSRSLGGGAARQLAAVRRDHTGATTSQGAGRTYDGNTAAPAQLTPSETTPIGPQDTAPDRTPSVNPSGGSDPQFPEEPPTVTGKNVTPWQAAINTAMLAILGAGLLLMAASKLAKMASTVAMAKGIVAMLCLLASALGAWVVKLGGQIGGGEYGQPLQGGLLALAGGLIIATSAIMTVSAFSAEGEKVDVWAKNAFSGNMNILMMLCGGAAMAAMAWAYMAPKKSYDPGLFKDGRPPDYDHAYEAAQVVTPPSQGILDQYLA
jgi:hypothetical protein